MNQIVELIVPQHLVLLCVLKHVHLNVIHALIHADSNVELVVLYVLQLVEQNAILIVLKNVPIIVQTTVYNHVLRNVVAVLICVIHVLECVLVYVL